MKKGKNMTIAGAALAMGLVIPQVLPTLTYAEVMQNDSVVKLRILETSDIHTNLMDYDYYQTKPDTKVGLARTATLIKQARSEVKNSLLFDNGDALQGTPLGDYIYKNNKLNDEDHPVYRVMNDLNYDAATVGNHEFNYGLPFLDKAMTGADFPIVNANVYVDDHDTNPSNDVHYFTPYKIVDKEVEDENGQKQTIKVGVIGFVPPQILQWDKSNLEGKVIAKDIVQSAQTFIPKMKAEGADVIVVLSHSGMGNEDSYNVGDENVSAYLAKNVPGIDAVLTGHSHLEVAKTINGVPVTMPSSFGSAMGVIDLELHKVDGKWAVNKAASQAKLRYIYDAVAKQPLVQADSAIVSLLQADHEGTITYVNQPVGTSTAPINSYFALVQDDPSVQLVSNAQKDYVENWLKQPENKQYQGIPVLSAAAPFKAGGRNGADYYTDIAAGTLAVKNMADLYVYPNTLQAVLITGADLKEWLEMSAGQFNQVDVNKATEQELVNTYFPTYNFDVLDGVQYQIDVTQPAKYDSKNNVLNANASRIANLTYNGKPVAPDQKFIVATNNYRASNAGNPKGFPGVRNGQVILQSPDENRQVIVNYIKNKGTVNPSADGNWSFKPVYGKTLKVGFDSAPKAQNYLAGQTRIAYSGASASTGFVRYAIGMTTDEYAAAPVAAPAANTFTVSDADVQAVLPKTTLSVAIGQNDNFVLSLTKKQVKMLADKGASVKVGNAFTSVKVPAANFSNKDVSIRATRWDNPAKPAAGFLSPMYMFTVLQNGQMATSFKQPVTISFPVNKESVKNAANVKLFATSPGQRQWKALAGTYADGKVTATTQSLLSLYTVLEAAGQTVTVGQEGK